MQNSPPDDEMIAALRAHTAGKFPKPAPAEALSLAGLERLQSAGLTYYAEHLSASGTGYSRNGNIALADPVMADALMKELDLLSPNETAIALVYQSFGQLSLVTTGGTEIHINPTGGHAMVFEGAPEDPIFLEFEIASLIEMAALEGVGANKLIDLKGKGLHAACKRQLGKPPNGYCYALLPDLEDMDRYNAETVTLKPLNDYLISLYRSGHMEITRVPIPSPDQLVEFDPDEE